MRLRNLVLVLAVLALVVALAACSSAGQSSGDQGSSDQGQEASKEPASKEPASEEQAQEQAPPEKMTEEAKEQQVAPKTGKQVEAQSGENKVEPPKKKRFKLTVPAMKRIEDDPIPTGSGTDEKLFRDYAGVHLAASGFPWNETSNVYIAGHRIGFPGTRSNKAFYDLEELKNGDKVYLEDAEGRRYTYEVFEKLVVEPTNLTVINPIPGKNIVSLQTCTLPDYAKRIIYRAELKDIEDVES